jgi:hypothetical protein
MIDRRVGALRWLLPQIGDFLAVAVFIGVIGLGPRIMNVDGDVGRHLVLGSYILDTQKIPTVDIFSHTMNGYPLTPHEWLSEVFFALSYRWMGLNGVVWLSAVLLALAFFLLFRLTLQRSKSPLISLAIVLVGIAASSLHWLSRPHLFTFVLVGLWTLNLEHLRTSHGKKWWVFPILMLLWVNLHGAFLVGFVLWLLAGAGEIFDRLFRPAVIDPVDNRFWSGWAAAGGSSLAVTLVNPAGVKIWETTVGYIQNRYLVGHTAEYLSPDFHQPGTWPFLLMILAVIVLLGLKNKPIRMGDLLLLTSWTVMGLFSMRNIPIFVLVAAPILAAMSAGVVHENPMLKGWGRVDERLLIMQRSLHGFVWPVIALAVGTLVLGSGPKAVNRFSDSTFPTAAADWVETEHPDGRMFNYFPWGGYLLYRLWPEYQVFIDGQTDFYGEALTREYENVITVSDGWQQTLDRYQVDWVIIPPQERLAEILDQESNWRVVYKDTTAVVFVRDE